MTCCAVLCCAVLSCAVLCCAMRCDAMRCDAMRCDAMLCYVMKHHVYMFSISSSVDIGRCDSNFWDVYECCGSPALAPMYMGFGPESRPPNILLARAGGVASGQPRAKIAQARRLHHRRGPQKERERERARRLH